MLLHKTELARALLARNGSELTRQERQLLILCDGQRTLDQLVALLGVDALGMIQKMIGAGYIRHAVTHTQAPKESRFGRLVGGLRAAASTIATTATIDAPATGTAPVVARALEAASPPKPAAAAPTATSAPAVAPVRPVARRSMAACKMYMIDMLQLQRTPDAASLAVTLQTSREEAELVAGFIDALVYLLGSTKSTVSERVAERLKEIIPEEHLGAVETAWVQMTTQSQLDAAAEVVETQTTFRDNVVPILPARVA